MNAKKHAASLPILAASSISRPAVGVACGVGGLACKLKGLALGDERLPADMGDSMADVDGKIAAWFSRHLVTLEVSYTVKHQNKPHQQTRSYYTGFLLWEPTSGEEGATIWVTAGHCMREIDDDLLGKPEHYADVRFRFVDTLHDAVVSELPVPFDYQAEKVRGWLVHTNERGVELGLDFGVIFLRPHYSRALFANRITPVAEENWKNVPDTFDKYFMLGLPAERVGPNQQGTWTASPSMVEVARLNKRPECFAEHTDEMIYGVADPDSRVRNIQGMSGGPIIGLKRGDDMPTVIGSSPFRAVGTKGHGSCAPVRLSSSGASCLGS